MSALEEWRQTQKGRVGPAPIVERHEAPGMTRPDARALGDPLRPPVSKGSSRPGYTGGTTLSSPYGARPEQAVPTSPGFRSLSPSVPRGITPPVEEPRDLRLPSPSKLRRFRLDRTLMSAAVAATSAEFYTEESLLHRLSLMKHPAVRVALDKLWSAANFDDSDAVIDKKEYLVMHRKLALALDPTVHPAEWEVAVQDDWLRDVDGMEETGIDREKFDWCWFELADLWTESMEAETYANFLTDLQQIIAQPKKEEGVAAAEMAIEGETVAAVWHSDADVITAHFETREEKREAAGEAKKRVKPEDSEQACQSRWAAWAQRQRPRRRTRSLIDVATTVMVANKIGKAPPPLVAVPPLPHRQGLYARPQSARRAAEATAVLAPAVKGSSGRAVAEARRAWLG